jgi:hypothetical protein
VGQQEGLEMIFFIFHLIGYPTRSNLPRFVKLVGIDGQSDGVGVGVGVGFGVGCGNGDDGGYGSTTL